MNGRKVVLVTGVAGYWGAQVAERLLLHPDYHVIGLDGVRPEEEIEGLDFIRADVRTPLIPDLLKTESVDTVCHLTFLERAQTSAAYDIHVTGTIRMLEAAAETGVRKVILRSSTAVYGALPGNSAFLKEEQPPASGRSAGYTRQLVEIEAFCKGFRHHSPQVNLTILRFANIIGPVVNTPVTRFLRGAYAPVLLGFDPMMQVIHEKDVLNALVYAIEQDVPGVYNVAAEGVLPLTKIMALTKTFPIPVLHWIASRSIRRLRRRGFPVNQYMPFELDRLRYACVGDTTRMREEMGFAPGYRAEEALREFALRVQTQRTEPEAVSLAQDEEILRDTLERRQRRRDQQPGEPIDNVGEVDDGG